MVSRVVLTSMLMLLPAVTQASGSPSGDTKYYKDSDQPGFYWQKDPQAVDKEPEPIMKPPVENKIKNEPVNIVIEHPKELPNTQRRIPKMSDYSKKDLWAMHPDDFQPLLEDFKKKAVMSVSEKDVEEYLEMQDMARRKALAYTYVSQLVLQKQPKLSLEKDYSPASPGLKIRNVMVNKSRNDRIMMSREDFAMILFYKTDCQYCYTQSDIMRMFNTTYNWSIKSVNINENPDVARRFNITTVPALILIKRGDPDFLPIATGVVALDYIINRVANGIRLLNKEIRPEQYYMNDFDQGGGFDPLASLQ